MKKIVLFFALFLAFCGRKTSAFFDIQYWYGSYPQQPAIMFPDMHGLGDPFQIGILTHLTGSEYVVYDNSYSPPIPGGTMLTSRCKFSFLSSDWAFGCVGYYYYNGGIDVDTQQPYAYPVFGPEGGSLPGYEHFQDFGNSSYFIGDTSEFTQMFGLRLLLNEDTTLKQSEYFVPDVPGVVLTSYPGPVAGKTIIFPGELSSVVYSPGTNFSIVYTTGGQTEESLIYQPYLRFYEVHDEDFETTTGTVTYYDDLLIGYISNTGDNYSYLTEGPDYRTYVILHTGGTYLFQLFDCFGRSINQIKNSCGSPILEGELGNGFTSHLNYFSRTEPTFGAAHSGFVNPAARVVGNEFTTSLNKQYPYSYLTATVGSYTITGTLVDDLTSTQEVYTPPQTPVDPFVNYTGNIVSSGSTVASSNIFGGITITGAMLFQCSDEFASGGIHLYFSEIPVLGDLYTLIDDIPGFSLPDIDIFGALACPYGAYIYGSQNVMAQPQAPDITEHNTRFNITQGERDVFNTFINMLLAIPALYLGLKILRG